MTILFEDLFATAGGYESPDPAKWTMRDDSFGSNHLAAYNPRQANVRVTPYGYAEIRAYSEPWTPPPGKGGAMAYTTGRIESVPRFSAGVFEARMRLPVGAKVQGSWPSFWLRGDGSWPQCGEIDAMEAINAVPFVAFNLHGADPVTGAHWNVGREADADADFRDLSSGWHVYRVERRAQWISWSVDGCETFRVVRTAFMPAAIFDAPMYLVAELRVGGWAGAPAADTSWPMNLAIDYVRVSS